MCIWGETGVVVSTGEKEKTKGCRHEAYDAPRIERKKNIILALREIIIERTPKWYGVELGEVLPYVIIQYE
jgi:hypothetical protein